jgi:hypothetical protein
MSRVKELRHQHHKLAEELHELERRLSYPTSMMFSSQQRQAMRKQQFELRRKLEGLAQKIYTLDREETLKVIKSLAKSLFPRITLQIYRSGKVEGLRNNFDFDWFCVLKHRNRENLLNLLTYHDVGDFHNKRIYHHDLALKFFQGKAQNIAINLRCQKCAKMSISEWSRQARKFNIPTEQANTCYTLTVSLSLI